MFGGFGDIKGMYFSGGNPSTERLIEFFDTRATGEAYDRMQGASYPGGGRVELFFDWDVKDIPISHPPVGARQTNPPGNRHSRPGHQSPPVHPPTPMSAPPSGYGGPPAPPPQQHQPFPPGPQPPYGQDLRPAHQQNNSRPPYQQNNDRLPHGPSNGGLPADFRAPPPPVANMPPPPMPPHMFNGQPPTPASAIPPQPPTPRVYDGPTPPYGAHPPPTPPFPPNTNSGGPPQPPAYGRDGPVQFQPGPDNREPPRAVSTALLLLLLSTDPFRVAGPFPTTPQWTSRLAAAW